MQSWRRKKGLFCQILEKMSKAVSYFCNPWITLCFWDRSLRFTLGLIAVRSSQVSRLLPMQGRDGPQEFKFMVTGSFTFTQKEEAPQSSQGQVSSLKQISSNKYQVCTWKLVLKCCGGENILVFDLENSSDPLTLSIQFFLTWEVLPLQGPFLGLTKSYNEINHITLIFCISYFYIYCIFLCTVIRCTVLSTIKLYMTVGCVSLFFSIKLKVHSA